MKDPHEMLSEVTTLLETFGCHGVVVLMTEIAGGKASLHIAGTMEVDEARRTLVAAAASIEAPKDTH